MVAAELTPILVAPPAAAFDEPVDILVRGCEPGQAVELAAGMSDPVALAGRPHCGRVRHRPEWGDSRGRGDVPGYGLDGVVLVHAAGVGHGRALPVH